MVVLRVAGREIVARFEPDDAPAVGLKPGDQAPEFSLTLDDGSTYQLNDLKGNPIRLAARESPELLEVLPSEVTKVRRLEESNAVDRRDGAAI